MQTIPRDVRGYADALTFPCARKNMRVRLRVRSFPPYRGTNHGKSQLARHISVIWPVLPYLMEIREVSLSRWHLFLHLSLLSRFYRIFRNTVAERYSIIREVVRSRDGTCRKLAVHRRRKRANGVIEVLRKNRAPA